MELEANGSRAAASDSRRRFEVKLWVRLQLVDPLRLSKLFGVKNQPWSQEPPLHQEGFGR